tara:strand:- start:494 stop:1177 length:684 start_codon:yes stop_codon:yes gene_type:complete
MNHSKNILIITAHTDDETLGMGGTIAKHKKNGDNIFAISMTDGVSSRNKFNQKDIKKRQNSSSKASKILGFTWLDNKNFPDNKLDTVPLLEIVKIIEKYKIEINPAIIYTHCASDLNIDHKLVCQATLIAFRPLANANWSEIRTFEIPSSTDYGHNSVTGNFNPNLFINIKDYWEKKSAALESYKNEIMQYPNSRSLNKIKILAEFRGGQCGLEKAEAFEIIRVIDR